MSQTKSLVLLAGAALSLGGVQAALAQQASPDEVRAIVAEMLADAETRSSLLQGGATAGRDAKGFFVQSADGNNRLGVGGQIQFRYLLNFRNDDTDATTNTNPTQDDFDSGFQVRRARLDFRGHVINPDWFYRVRIEANRDGGDVALNYAYMGYNFGNGWKGMWGQFKLPLLREELVGSDKQLAAERSLTNSVFTQGYSQGAQLSYEAEDWNFKFAFSDGLATANTDFTTNLGGFAPLPTTGPYVSDFVIGGGEADYALTGRFEYRFAGDWKQFDDFTSEQGSAFASLLGLAAHWQESANTNAPGDVDVQTLEYTADLTFEGDSWNIYGAFIGRYNNVRDSVPQPSIERDFNDFGAVVQGGFRLAKDDEIFARWDGFWPDEDRNLTNDDYNFLTVGWNHYYAGHAAKATIDAVWAFEDTQSLTAGQPLQLLPNTGIGLLGSTDDNEVVVRFQFQLLF